MNNIKEIIDMTLSKNLKKIMVTGAAIIMAASTMAGVSNVNANARRYHYRTHRVVRRRTRRARKARKMSSQEKMILQSIKTRRPNSTSDGYVTYGVLGVKMTPTLRRALNKRWGHSWYTPVRRHTKKHYRRTRKHAKKYSNLSYKRFLKKYDLADMTTNVEADHQCNLAQDQLVKDINSARTKNGLNGLSLDYNLSCIAEQRASQLQDNFSHFDNSGNKYAEDDGVYNYTNDWGENIGNQSQTGRYGRHTYDMTGRRFANTDIDQMLHHDSSSNWGHRANILGNFSSLGIGVNYNPNKQAYTECQIYGN